MIENEQQYRVTLSAIARFKEALARNAVAPSTDLSPGMQQVIRAAFDSEIEVLCDQVRAYAAGQRLVPQSTIQLPALLSNGSKSDREAPRRRAGKLSCS